MGKKILLADDSITIQKVIELTFSDEDFEVVTVGNGRLAMEKVQEMRPDVILCDIIMPEKDGYEVCEFVKKNPSLGHIPVLLLTGAFEPFDQERAQRAGADGSLAKPFEPETLIAKVKELLRKAAPAPSSPRPVAVPPPPPPPAPTPLATTPDLGMPAVRPAPAQSPQTQAFPAYMTQPNPASPIAPPPAPKPLSPPIKTFEQVSGRTLPGEPVLTPEPDVSFIPDEPFGVLDADAFAVAPEPLVEPEPERRAEPLAPAFDPDLYAPADEETPELLEVTAEESASLSVPPPEEESASTVMFRPGVMPWSAPRPEPVHEAPRPAAAPEPDEPPALEEVFEEAVVTFDVNTQPAITRKTPAPQPAVPSPPPPRPPAFEPVARFEPVRFEPPSPMEALAGPPVEEEFPVEPEPAFAPRASEPEPELIPMVEQAPPPPAAPSFAEVARETAPEPPPLSQAAQVDVPVDMVEKIAQRVVAQISEKVIQQIAWEVIPDLAEAMIRREIDRLKQELQQV